MSTDTVDLAGALHSQLVPGMQMLLGCLEASRDELWDARRGGPPVWEQLYHTLFWLHAWLRDWSRPLEYPPFHVEEALDLRSPPGRAITRLQMRGYQDRVVADCRAYLSALTPETMLAPSEAFGKQWTPLDRILGQIRHIQHHVGYLNAVLRASGCTPVRWVGFQEDA